jgi:hypothetical protein
MAQTARSLSNKNNNKEVIKLAAKQWADLLIAQLNHQIVAYANTTR